MNHKYLIFLFCMFTIGVSFTSDIAWAEEPKKNDQSKDKKPNDPIPFSADEEWCKRCVDISLNINGDFQGINTWGLGQWSVGPAVSTQLVIYDFEKEKAGINQSIGVGAAFRFYRPIKIKNKDGTEKKINISQVKPECRQTSFGREVPGEGGRPPYLAAPFFSITPTLYTSKEVDENDMLLQLALLLGFFEDIINVGVGYNLTGPDEEKGNVFLLFGIGVGFRF